MTHARIAVDLAFFAGVLTIAGGFFWAYPPLGLISLGLMVCGTIGIFWYRGQDAKSPQSVDAAEEPGGDQLR